MSWTILLLGLGLVLAIMVDVFGTTFAPTQFRFIAYHVGHLVWALLAMVGEVSGSSKVRASAGSFTVFCVFFVWLVGSWAAWTIAFMADPNAVVDVVTGAPAAFLDRLYYVGGLLSTLGVGDFHSATPLWRMLSVVAALFGLTIITLAISNFVTAVFSLSESRALAGELASLGEKGAEMVCSGWDGKSFAPLEQRFQPMLTGLFQHAERSRASGIVSQFVYAERHRSIAPTIAALDDALLLLRLVVADEVRPHRLLMTQLSRAIDAVVPEGVKPAPAPWPVAEELIELRAAGIPLASNAADLQPGGEDAVRRDRIAGWLKQTGWEWGGKLELPSSDVPLSADRSRMSQAGERP